MNILMRIWAFITRGRLVWLRDMDGECTLSIARATPFGDVMAKRHWPFNIMNVRLNPDRTVADGLYVVEWKDA